MIRISRYSTCLKSWQGTNSLPSEALASPLDMRRFSVLDIQPQMSTGITFFPLRDIRPHISIGSTFSAQRYPFFPSLPGGPCFSSKASSHQSHLRAPSPHPRLFLLLSPFWNRDMFFIRGAQPHTSGVISFFIYFFTLLWLWLLLLFWLTKHRASSLKQ